MIGKKLPRRKIRSASVAAVFQDLCGLPAKIEKAEPQRALVVNRLSDPHCRGGIFDELKFGAPVRRTALSKKRK